MCILFFSVSGESGDVPGYPHPNPLPTQHPVGDEGPAHEEEGERKGKAKAACEDHPDCLCEKARPAVDFNHSPYLFVLAANRDEEKARPSAKATFWEDYPDVLGGYDLFRHDTVPYGTWLGITKTGRFAALTNIREVSTAQAPHGRGELTRDFLTGTDTPKEYCERVVPVMSDYGGMNLVVGDLKGETGPSLWFVRNRGEEEPFEVVQGLHSLSNASLDSPWPKCKHGRAEFSTLDFSQPEDNIVEALLQLLKSRTKACLPSVQHTGVLAEIEQKLSSVFVDEDHLKPYFEHPYGTIAHTVLLVTKSGDVTFVEVTPDDVGPADTVPWSRRQFNFNLWETDAAGTEESA